MNLGWINDYTKEQSSILWGKKQKRDPKERERKCRIQGGFLPCAACIVRVAGVFVGITVGEVRGMVGRKYQTFRV